MFGAFIQMKSSHIESCCQHQYRVVRAFVVLTETIVNVENSNQWKIITFTQLLETVSFWLFFFFRQLADNRRSR